MDAYLPSAYSEHRKYFCLSRSLEEDKECSGLSPPYS